jgi:hypothetical protein
MAQFSFGAQASGGHSAVEEEASFAVLVGLQV